MKRTHFIWKLRCRAETLALTLVSKKYAMVVLATVLLTYRYITGETWAMFCFGVLGVHGWEKIKGVNAYDYPAYPGNMPPMGE